MRAADLFVGLFAGLYFGAVYHHDWMVVVGFFGLLILALLVIGYRWGKWKARKP